MGAIQNEPSMEEILSSIKRIIAEEDRAVPARAPRRAPANGALRAVDNGTDEQILELTDALPEQAESAADQAVELQSEPETPELDTAPVDAPPVAAVAETKPVELKPAKAETPKAEAPKADTKAPKAEAKSARRDTASPSARKTAMPQAVLSDVSAQAARESLVNLSQLLVRPEDGQSNTLEGVVREMLRPMLKDWLDAHLPEMVETMVKREIDRITGRV
jgi:cell pole-organizing protein PopZ